VYINGVMISTEGCIETSAELLARPRQVFGLQLEALATSRSNSKDGHPQEVHPTYGEEFLQALKHCIDSS